MAGLHVTSWVYLYLTCHSFVMGSPVRTQWPDGRSTLRQPAVTVQMFELIAEEIVKEQEAQRERDASRPKRN